MTDEDMIDLVIAAQHQANLVLDRLIQLKDDPHKASRRNLYRQCARRADKAAGYLREIEDILQNIE